jgi:hypothetical protein
LRTHRAENAQLLLDALGKPLRLVVATFIDPSPVDLAPSDDAFRCPFRFDAEVNACSVSEKDLASRLPTAEPESAKLHDQIAGRASLNSVCRKAPIAHGHDLQTFAVWHASALHNRRGHGA